MTRLTPLGCLALILVLAACHRPAPARPPGALPHSVADGGAGRGPTGTTASSSDGGTASDGGVATGPAQPPAAYTQHEPIKPCSPHVDGSDSDHRVFLVETAAHESAHGGQATLDLLGLDSPGACAFSRRKPASFRGLDVRITVPGESVPIGHYLVGKEGKVTTSMAFVFTGPRGHEHVRKILTGFVDVIAAARDHVEIGFNVHDATGASYGCFSAPTCR